MGRGDRVLEVGVGTGLSLPFYPRDCHVTGIDISEPMLEQARDRAVESDVRSIDLRVMDAHRLTFPDGRFDHVMAPYVISVVPEPERVMAEIARVVDRAVRSSSSITSAAPGAAEPRRAFADPASQWIGFRLDLPVETVTRTPGLEVVRVDRVNLFGMWRLVELRRPA